MYIDRQLVNSARAWRGAGALLRLGGSVVLSLAILGLYLWDWPMVAIVRTIAAGYACTAFAYFCRGVALRRLLGEKP